VTSNDVASATPEWFTTALAAPVEVGEVEVAGVPIAYRTWGETGGDGLVLVHGGAAHSRWWDHIAPLLVGDAPRVVAIDLSGHGDSGRRACYDLAGWADEVLAVAGHAGLGAEPVVVGHSMGGMVALSAALRFGARLGGVVVIDSPIRDRPPEERAARDRRAFGPLRTYATREQAVAHFRPVPAQPDALAFVRDHIAATSVRPVDGGWAWKFDPGIFGGIGMEPAELAVVECRVALFRAAHGLVPAEMGDMIVDRMGSLVPVVEIPAAGHHVMLDQPLAMVTGLRTLLADWRHSTPLTLPTSGTSVA
jgi:pimeloyl-ACP methyl ester carboxylesterase